MYAWVPPGRARRREQDNDVLEPGVLAQVGLDRRLHITGAHLRIVGQGAALPQPTRAGREQVP